MDGLTVSVDQVVVSEGVLDVGLASGGLQVSVVPEVGIGATVGTAGCRVDLTNVEHVLTTINETITKEFKEDCN